MGRPIGSDIQCWQGDVGSRIKRHSVPTNEALGLLQGVESVAAFLYEHADMILKNSPNDGKLVVSFGLDSSCVASSLNPKMIHKQVLIKNLTNKVHETTKDITSLYPSIAIVFYHIKGINNIADYNSKIPSDYDAISIINSTIWRQGLPEFCNYDFPQPDRVFMEVHEGQITNFRQPILDNKICSCNGEFCTQITRSLISICLPKGHVVLKIFLT